MSITFGNIKYSTDAFNSLSLTFVWFLKLIWNAYILVVCSVMYILWLITSLTTALRERRFPWSRQLITPKLPGFPMWRVSIVIQITLQNLINCSMYRCRTIPKISSKCPHNLLSKVRPNDPISIWAVSTVIQITTQI